MYQDVQRLPQSPIPLLVQSWAPIRAIQAIEHGFQKLQSRFAAWQESQAAVRDLQRLDDHLLRDLGIERREIPEIVAKQSAARW